MFSIKLNFKAKDAVFLKCNILFNKLLGLVTESYDYRLTSHMGYICGSICGRFTLIYRLWFIFFYHK